MKGLKSTLASVAVAVVLCVGCAGPSKSLVEYDRKGGIASLDDRFMVNAAGSMTYKDRNGKVTGGTAPAEEVAKLTRLINAPEFVALGSRTLPAQGPARITHTVRARTEKGQVTVTAVEGSEQPRELQDVLAELQKLISMCK